MSYTKQSWNTGDVITADKLNHIEDGISNIGGGIMYITFTDEEIEDNIKVTLNRTYREIRNAIDNRALIYSGNEDYSGNTNLPEYINYFPVISAYYKDGYYHVDVDGTDLTAENEDGYPTHIIPMDGAQ